MSVLTLSDSEKSMTQDGLTVQEATIQSIQDVSGQQLKFMAKGPCDLGVTLKIDIGRTFFPEMTIAGVFKRGLKGDNPNAILAWGGAFVVADFFRAMGIQVTLDDKDPKIPEAWLTQCIGKKFLKLSYTTGKKDEDKFKYSDWMQIGKVSDGAQKLLTRFRNSAKNGYPRNYISPEKMVVGAGDPMSGTSFNIEELEKAGSLSLS